MNETMNEHYHQLVVAVEDLKESVKICKEKLGDVLFIYRQLSIVITD
jgi:hypothetical protein